MTMTPDSFNRLSLGFIEKEKCSPKQAISKLNSLQLNLVCGNGIENALPLQAALLTAVNTAKRAFLGGVHVYLHSTVQCLLPWPAKKSLNAIIEDLGGEIGNQINNEIFSLHFGLPGNIDKNQIQVVCNDWQAGILADGECAPFDQTGTIPTAGIFAGGFAVAMAFLKVSQINIAACDQSMGVSLWRPDLDWLSEEAKGPVVEFLPEKYWILGLGHLGQAYVWNIGLLPYSSNSAPVITLQDFDKVVEANWSAGLLCETENVNQYKTRICSNWLESRGFKTIITERRFDEHTKRVNEEPFVALCGFDSALSRLNLENAGFDLIVESGLGSRISTFDIISLHTFPDASKTAFDIWGEESKHSYEVNEIVLNVLNEISDKEACGIVPIAIAGKSLSASFVGACAGALVVSELIRGLHGGKRYERINFQLRNLGELKAVIHKSDVYSLQQSRNGFTTIDSDVFNEISL